MINGNVLLVGLETMHGLDRDELQPIVASAQQMGRFLRPGLLVVAAQSFELSAVEAGRFLQSRGKALAANRLEQVIHGFRFEGGKGIFIIGCDEYDGWRIVVLTDARSGSQTVHAG